MTAVKDFWQGLSPREQVLIAVMLMLFSLVLVWLLVVRPLADSRSTALATYEAAARDAREVEAAVALSQTLGTVSEQDRPAPAANEAAIRSIVSQTTKVRGLTLSRLQPDTTTGGLTVWFDTADPKQILDWVRTLYEDHGISASRLSLQRTDENAVRAQMLLVPAGS